MRFSAVLCLLLCCASVSHAVDVITATVTVTNTAGTTNGQTITVNGNLRTWTNSVQVAASQILTNAAIGGAATNLFNQFSGNPFTSLSLARSGTNGLTLTAAPGVILTVSLSVGWGSVSYGTQTIVSAYAVRVPYTVDVAAAQTNIVSAVIALLNAGVSTNVIYESAVSFANLLGKTNTQTITGAKTFSNTNNTFIGNGVFNNGLRITNDFSNVASFQLSGDPTTGGQTWTFQLSPGGMTIAASGSTMLILPGQLIAGGDILLGNWNLTGGKINVSTNGFSGNGESVTNLHGTNIQGGTIDGSRFSSNGLALPAGTNTFPAGADVAFGRYALTSLANGNNAAIVVGTNVFVEVSGPSAAFTICGIAGGRDGKVIEVYNGTGFDLTIAHQSGTDPVAANRIITMTGADRTTTGNGFVTLIYSGAASRWIQKTFDP